MHALFESVLMEARTKYVVLRGSREERMAEARRPHRRVDSVRAFPAGEL
jgi:hypothetical protein